jgi:hypothetical protein
MKTLPVGTQQLFHPEVWTYMMKLTAKAPAQKRHTVFTQFTGRSVRLVTIHNVYCLYKIDRPVFLVSTDCSLRGTNCVCVCVYIYIYIYIYMCAMCDVLRMTRESEKARLILC